MDFSFDLSSFVKNAIGIFMGIVLNLQILFSDRDIFRILILPTNKHGDFPINSYVFNVLKFLLQRAFISLVKFIPSCIFKATDSSDSLTGKFFIC